MGHKEDGRRRGLSVQSCRLVMSRDSGCDDFQSFRAFPLFGLCFIIDILAYFLDVLYLECILIIFRHFQPIFRTFIVEEIIIKQMKISIMLSKRAFLKSFFHFGVMMLFIFCRQYCIFNNFKDYYQRRLYYWDRQLSQPI